MSRRKVRPVVVGAFLSDVNLNLSYSITPDDLLAVGRKMSKIAEVGIRDRVKTYGQIGTDPFGQLPTAQQQYSSRPLKLPYKSNDDDRIGSKRKKKYDKVMKEATDSGFKVAEKGESGWQHIRFPGGWRQFRQFAGLQVKYMDLSFTGQMLADVRVEPFVEYLGTGLKKTHGADKKRRAFRPEFARTIATIKGVRQLSKNHIDLKRKLKRELESDFRQQGNEYGLSFQVGFGAEENWRLAMYHAEWGRHFAFITPEELKHLGEKAKGLLEQRLDGKVEMAPINILSGRVHSKVTGRFLPFER
jgi:hypothetical protein